MSFRSAFNIKLNWATCATGACCDEREKGKGKCFSLAFIPGGYLICVSRAQRQDFRMLCLIFWFIWKALGCWCGFPRLHCSWISTAEVASAKVAGPVFSMATSIWETKTQAEGSQKCPQLWLHSSSEVLFWQYDRGEKPVSEGWTERISSSNN